MVNLFNESPDFVDHEFGEKEALHWSDNDCFVFGYIGTKFLFSKKSPRVRIHSELVMKCLNDGTLKPGDLGEIFETTSYVGRDLFTLAGRGWSQDKILSFWHNPSKSELDKLIVDLKSNGVTVDGSWKIEVGNKLVSIDEYGDSNKNIKVKQIQHLIDPIVKNKMKNPNDAINSKDLPSGFKSWAEYHNFAMKSESIDILTKIKSLIIEA